MATTWEDDEALSRLSVANLAKTAPVTPPEERRLILEMVDGKNCQTKLDQTNAVSSGNALSEEEKADYRERAERGRKARETLIVANGRLVISFACRYTGGKLTLAELSQEGVLGLIRAIDKFDPNRGVRLSTYATFWIWQSIGRAVASQTRTIRLPAHKVGRLGAIRKASNQLTQTLGREPAFEEIAAALDDTPSQIEALLWAGQETLSLEEPVGDDGATRADGVWGDDQTKLENEVDKTLLEDKIQEALGSLTARESRILELRYGLGSGQPLTLKDVAERFGLTRERIRQIEKDALAKLRRPEKAIHLRSFF